jgi:DtxR family Mn-dependent transcriptional regulator
MIERLFERLGQPERCPHGYPIDPDHELRENPTLKAVSQLLPGTDAEVVRLAEHDAPLLHSFYEAGLEPGTQLTVSEQLPEGGALLSLNVGQVVISPGQAQGLFVRPAGVPVVPATATCWGDILKRERALVAETD